MVRDSLRKLLNVKVMGRESVFSTTPYGLLRQKARVKYTKPYEEVFVLGRAWMFVMLNIPENSYGAARHRNRDIEFTGPTAFFMPPTSMIRFKLENADYAIEAFYGTGDLPEYLSWGPCAIRNAPPLDVDSADDVFDYMRANLDNLIPVANELEPNMLGQRAKAWIDANFSRYTANIRSLAVDLNASREAVSRAFKSAYGIPPSQYLIRLRIADSLRFLFMKDSTVIATSHAIGFQETSQFHRHFQKYNQTSPSRCRFSGRSAQVRELQPDQSSF